MSKIDSTDETISDIELNDIEYILMQDTISKGRNVKIRVRSKNWRQ